MIAKMPRSISSKSLWCLILLFSPGLALALGGPDTAIIMQNLGIIARIIQSISVVMGIGMIFLGIMKLKQYGEMRNMTSQHGGLAGCVFMLLAGVILLALPTMLSTFLMAFWGTANPLPYPTTNDPSIGALMKPIVLFVRIVGVVAFIRGVVLLSHLGKEGGQQQGGIGKALMFMLGGILCVHIMGTVDLLRSVVGFTGA